MSDAPQKKTVFGMFGKTFFYLSFLALIFVNGQGRAENSRAVTGREVRVAAAANIVLPLEELRLCFLNGNPETEITIIQGSSGKLSEQIRMGGPFDIFLGGYNVSGFAFDGRVCRGGTGGLRTRSCRTVLSQG